MLKLGHFEPLFFVELFDQQSNKKKHVCICYYLFKNVMSKSGVNNMYF